MTLRFADDEPFTAGATEYYYSASTPSRQTADRMTLLVEIEEQEVEAIIDTGACYLICHPELARAINFDPGESIPTENMNIRGLSVKGELYGTNLCFLADEGNNLSIEATAFVPTERMQDDVANRLPKSFLGLVGCLERVRFAVDPFNRIFYFGGHPG